MLTATVLICALASPICNATTARAILRSPESYASPAMCAASGMALLAGTEMGRQVAADEIVRIECR